MDDLFGFSLEINDWNDTIVGAPGYNSNSGSIYIFSRDANSNLAQTGKIDPDFADRIFCDHWIHILIGCLLRSECEFARW